MVTDTRTKKILSHVWEIGKWALVIWLLLPMRKSLSEQTDFTRVALGILLFVIFAGKLLYDTIIESFIRRGQRSGLKDLITMVGIVVFISLIVGLVIFFVGFYVVNILSSVAGEGGG